VRETNSQAEVIGLLSDPATHGAGPVERIETHASIVFLAGTRAFKLKRAVRYDYLDFSTPDLRHRFCDAELRVNGRTAAGLYTRVVPIVRTAAGGLALGGPGTPVDWVVEMRRFDQAALFDRMAAEGRLDTGHVVALAEEIASFHQSCAVRTDCGGKAAMTRVIDGNAAGFRQFGHDTFDAAAADFAIAHARACLRQCGPLLDRRRTDGYVRECHGDLHLGNVVLFNGRPTLFDAIEFNDDISCIDVMYDAAFLLMDLWHRGLPALANAALNAYVRETHDLDGLAALPLFLACRAAIRAKTTATSASLQPASEDRRLSQESARQYLDLAVRLLQQKQTPAIVAVGGLSGSGKTTLARALAPSIGPAPGAVVLRSDEIRKRLWGVSPLTKVGPAGYTPEMSARVYETLAADAAAVARAGHVAVVDAVFARAEDRIAIERAAGGAGVRFAAVWLQAPQATLIERVSHRTPDASDADADVVRMQCAQWAEDVRWPRLSAAADPPAVEALARASLRAQMMALDAAA